MLRFCVKTPIFTPARVDGPIPFALLSQNLRPTHTKTVEKNEIHLIINIDFFISFFLFPLLPPSSPRRLIWYVVLGIHLHAIYIPFDSALKMRNIELDLVCSSSSSKGNRIESLLSRLTKLQQKAEMIYIDDDDEEEVASAKKRALFWLENLMREIHLANATFFQHTSLTPNIFRQPSNEFHLSLFHFLFRWLTWNTRAHASICKWAYDDCDVYRCRCQCLSLCRSFVSECECECECLQFFQSYIFIQVRWLRQLICFFLWRSVLLLLLRVFCAEN